MDELILFPTAGLALALAIAYFIRCYTLKNEFDVAVLVNIILASSGVVCGVFLVASTFMPELRDRLTGISLYIFIAGIVVLAVSAQSLKREILFQGKDQKAAPEGAEKTAP